MALILLFLRGRKDPEHITSRQLTTTYSLPCAHTLCLVAAIQPSLMPSPKTKVYYLKIRNTIQLIIVCQFPQYDKYYDMKEIGKG